MMSIDLEDQLRQAYRQLPEASSDPTEVIARSRRTAVRSRRRRTAGVCAGTVAAALAVGAVAIGGPLVTSQSRDTGLLPAGGSTSTPKLATRSAAKPSATAHSAAMLPGDNVPLPHEGTDKPLAGLSGRLLPHGSQLPTGVSYHGINVVDAKKTWTSSPADGYAHLVPVLGLIAADQNRNAPSPAAVNAAYGIVGGVWDGASEPGPDTSPTFRYLNPSIVRFRTPALAQAALAKTQRKEGGLYWLNPGMTKPNVAWSGVRGATGAHAVYGFPAGSLQSHFIAYQIVDDYIVSADSTTSAAIAEQAVTDMVGNLKNAGLLK